MGTSVERLIRKLTVDQIFRWPVGSSNPQSAVTRNRDDYVHESYTLPTELYRQVDSIDFVVCFISNADKPC